MTLIERLRRARRRLGAAALLSGAAWAVAVGGPVSLLVGRSVGLAVGLTVLAGVIWRRRRLRSIEAVALWVEERQPALQYAVVTAADPRVLAGGVPARLAEAAAGAEIESEVRRAARRLTAQAFLGVAVAALAWRVIGYAQGALTTSSAIGRSPEPPAAAPSRLVPLSARVEPPAYARLPASDVREPSSVAGLVGSRVTFAGRGAAEGITLRPDTTSGPITAAATREGWAARIRMPATPGIVTLADRGYDRLVVLMPRPDSAPVVTLALPVHDTTYRTVPAAPIALEARVTDDIGLAMGWFEYLISSGTGEHFTTVTRTAARVALGPGRTGVLRARLSLEGLKLTPGSVVNIRAIALDANDVTGPGKGVSETRTLRIAEPRDSLAVAPAPPDQLDSMLVSQRLLNLRTDTLLRTRARLTRAAVADRSMSYSNIQESIRLRVVTVVALLEDDGVGGTAPTEVSRLLRKAAEEMQAARIDLAIAAPETARPHMRSALAILDQVRNAHRYYLRGRAPPVLVDVERVRLQGEAAATPGPRTPRDQLELIELRLAERIERAVRLLASSREAALDSLTFVRVAALGSRPDLAEALGEAVDRLRAGAKPGPALAPVHRLLSRPPQPIGGPPEWLGGISP